MQRTWPGRRHRSESEQRNSRKGLRRALAFACAAVYGLAGHALADDPPTASIEPIPDAVWEKMQGSSWHADKPCPERDKLVLLKAPYRDFAGEDQLGELIVAKEFADQVAAAFTEIYDSGAFRIERMELVDAYGGDDDLSMAANNTSAFNCLYRRYDDVVGTRARHRHRHQSGAEPLRLGEQHLSARGQRLRRGA